MVCHLCEVQKKGAHVIKKTKNAFVCMNYQPIVKGHIMILPIKHKKSYKDLTKEEAKEMFLLVQEMSLVLRKTFNKGATLTAINHGKTQSEEHIHMHVMPDSENQKFIKDSFNSPARKIAEEKDLQLLKTKIIKGLN